MLIIVAMFVVVYEKFHFARMPKLASFSSFELVCGLQLTNYASQHIASRLGIKADDLIDVCQVE